MTEEDREFVEKVRSLSFHVSKPVRRPLGEKAGGRYIKGENGMRDILIPSFGALEQEEVDYLAEGALEKERDRMAKRETSVQKAALGSVIDEMRKAPRGQRAEVGENIIKEMQK